MADLATQLRDYLDATTPRVSLSEVSGLRAVRPASMPRRPDMDKDQPQAPSVLRWLRWPPVVAAAAAVAVLILIGGVALFALRLESGNGAVTDQPTLPVSTTAILPTTTAPNVSTTPSTATATASTTTVPVPVLQGMAWERIVMTWEQPAEVGTLIVGGPGYVLAGSVCETLEWGACAGPEPAVWVSSDGVGWQRVAEEAFAGVKGRITGIAAGPGGLVAVGTRADTMFGGGMAWYSPDGVTWTQAPDPGGVLVGSGVTVVGGITAGGPGFVAVGFENPAGSDTNAVVWVSEDGRSWTRIEDTDLLGDPATFVSEDMGTVMPGGPGLVAVGSSVWVSADGFDWAKVPRDAFEGLESPLSSRYGRAGLGFTHVTADPLSGSLILFRSGPHPQIWTSDSGTRWTRVPDPDDSWEGSGDGIFASAWDQQTVLAIGTLDEPGRLSLVASPDAGLHWASVEAGEFVPAPGHSLAARGIFFDGARFIVLGVDCNATGDECPNVMWIGTWDD
jgi:hypothetical protein